MAWYAPFSALTDIQRTVHAIQKAVDHLSSQNEELSQDVADLQAMATAISNGVTAALAHITDLEGQIASGQPVDPAVLASLKDAIASIGTAAQGVGGLATA